MEQFFDSFLLIDNQNNENKIMVSFGHFYYVLDRSTNLKCLSYITHSIKSIKKLVKELKHFLNNLSKLKVFETESKKNLLFRRR